MLVTETKDLLVFIFPDYQLGFHSVKNSFVLTAFIESQSHRIELSCTKPSLSVQFDELTQTYFIIFGHTGQVNGLSFEACQRLLTFLGFLTHTAIACEVAKVNAHA